MGSGAGLAMQIPSSFILCVPRVSQSPVTPRTVVMCSPLGLKIIAFHRDDFSYLHLLTTVRPGCPVPPLVGGSILGRPTYSIQWLRSIGWGLLRANQGKGYSGSPLPSCLSLSSDNLLYKEDFLRSVRSRLGLVSDRVVSFGLIIRRY